MKIKHFNQLTAFVVKNIHVVKEDGQVHQDIEVKVTFLWDGFKNLSDVEDLTLIEL